MLDNNYPFKTYICKLQNIVIIFKLYLHLFYTTYLSTNIYNNIHLHINSLAPEKCCLMCQTAQYVLANISSQAGANIDV